MAAPARCSWSNRCAVKYSPIRVSEDERYCRKHGRRVADKWVGIWVKLRDEECAACAKTTELQWAHIHTRDKNGIRWMTEPFPGNSVALCRGCHFAYTKNPRNWEAFVDRRWPGWYSELSRIQAEHEHRGDKINVAGIILRYRSEVEAINQGARR